MRLPQADDEFHASTHSAAGRVRANKAFGLVLANAPGAEGKRDGGCFCR